MLWLSVLSVLSVLQMGACARHGTLRTSQPLQLCCSHPGTVQTNSIHWQERGRVVVQNIFLKRRKIATIFRSPNQKKNMCVDWKIANKYLRFQGSPLLEHNMYIYWKSLASLRLKCQEQRKCDLHSLNSLFKLRVTVGNAVLWLTSHSHFLPVWLNPWK